MGTAQKDLLKFNQESIRSLRQSTDLDQGDHRRLEELLTSGDLDQKVDELLENLFPDAPAASKQPRSSKGKVAIEAADRQVIEYDHVVIATHPDQALKIIKNPKPAEQEVLGAFRYESNLAILHTDTSILPNTKRAWASWNYLVEERKELKASVTYWMNNLQSIEGDTQYLVTLNAEHRIKPDKIIRKIQYGTSTIR